MQALFNAGLKTQTALAERIADIEGLDAAPKDLVNRVFREVAVDPATIERLAQALGVESHTLYLTKSERDSELELASDDLEFTEPNPAAASDSQLEATSERPATDAAHSSPADHPVTHPINHPSDSDPDATASPLLKRPGHLKGNGNIFNLRKWLSASTVAALFGLAIFWWFKPSSENELNPAPQPLPASLVIYSADALLQPLAQSLALQLPDEIQAKVIDSQLVQEPAMAANIAFQFQSDAVITLTLTQVGRYQFTQLAYYSQGQQHQVQAEHHTSEQLRHNPEKLSKRFISAMADALQGQFSQEVIPMEDQTAFLKARDELDYYNSELHLQRGQASLYRLLNRHPNWGLIHAGLCDALTKFSWMGNEKSLLTSASKHCQKSLQQEPVSALAYISQANLSRRSGQLDRAETLLTTFLDNNPANADGLIALAIVHLEHYKQQGQSAREHLGKAIQNASLATQIDPLNWQAFSYLGLMHYYAQDMEKANRAFADSVAIRETPLGLTNWGTISFCLGYFDQAYQAYSRVRSLAPDSYLGDEYLANVAYYQSDFHAAAELRRAALEKIGSGDSAIHQMWGTLADAERQLNQMQQAEEHYRKAIVIADHDSLRGNSDITTEIYYAYYRQMLTKINPSDYPPQEYTARQDKLLTLMSNNTEGSGFLYLSAIFQEQGLLTYAREAWQNATSICPGYAHHPDVRGLID